MCQASFGAGIMVLGDLLNLTPFTRKSLQIAVVSAKILEHKAFWACLGPL